MIARSQLAAPIAAISMLGVLGCGSPGKTLMVHEPEAEAARALWTVDFVFEFTVPENFRYRTEEYGSVAADPGRGLIYVGSRDGTLIAITDDRGEFVWETALGGGLNGVPTLLSFDEDEQRARETAPGEPADWLLAGTDDGALLAFNLETREVEWRYRTSGVVRTAPVIGEGVVHFANSRDEIFAVDVHSGEWVWQYAGEFQKDFTVYGRAGLAYAPPEDATSGEAGAIYTGFGDGKVIALDANSGAVRWLEPLAPVEGNELFVDVDTTPVVVRDRGELIVANQASGVFALALDDGARRWNTEIRAVGSLSPAPGGLYIAASSLEGLFAVELDGRIRWNQQLDPGSLAPPLVVGNTVFAAHSDQGFLAYSVRDGELLARFETGSGSNAQPVFDPVLERVYASSDRGTLYALSLDPRRR